MKNIKLLAAVLILALCFTSACNKKAEETEVTKSKPDKSNETTIETTVTEETETSVELTNTPTATPTSSPTPTPDVPLDEKIVLVRNELMALHNAHPDDTVYIGFSVNIDDDFIYCGVYSTKGYEYEPSCEYVRIVSRMNDIEPDVYTYDWVMRHTNQEIKYSSLVDGIDTLPNGHYGGVIRSITSDGTMMEVTVGEIVGTGSSDYPIICNPVRLWIPINSSHTFYDGVSMFYYTNNTPFAEYNSILESPFWNLVTHNYTSEAVYIAYDSTPYNHSVYGPCYGFRLNNQRSAAEQRSYGYTYDSGVSVVIDVTDGSATRLSTHTS